MIAKEGKADLAQQVGSSIQKAKKFYLKAKKFYDSGELDKAIEYCNYSIGENIKNPSALNLKGLLTKPFTCKIDFVPLLFVPFL